MNSACDDRDLDRNGSCKHRIGAGLCARAVAPVCVDLVGLRAKLDSAPKLCVGSVDVEQLTRKVASSARVAIKVWSVDLRQGGRWGRVCAIGFDDGTVQVVDLLGDDCLDALMVALSKTQLIGIDLKDTLLSLAPLLSDEPRHLLDLGLVSRVLEGGNDDEGHDLEALLARHLGFVLKSSTKSLHWTGLLTRVHLIAVAEQVANLLHLADAMMDQVKARKLESVVALESQVIPATVEMQARGLPIDEARWFQKVAELELAALHAERDVHRAELEEDLSEADRLGAEVRSMQSILTGFVSVVSAALHKSPEPRVSGELHQLGTTTGRFSCEGVPLLSMPKKYGLRTCFQTPAGKTFVRGDFGCFELRVLAALANDTALLDVFHRGEDAHQLIASELLGTKLGSVTPEQRQRIKAVSFGVPFCMTPHGIVESARDLYGIKLSLTEAAEYQAAFFARFPKIAEFQAAILCGSPPITTTRLGRIRRWTVGDDRNASRVAFPVQGSAADAMKACIASLYWRLKALDAAILLVVHDEIIIECPVDVAMRVSALLEATMKASASSLFPEVPFVVNVSIVENLGDQEHG